jgi:murein DD-endopeptidase MepM/ murein hydrolase activator NlpD
MRLRHLRSGLVRAGFIFTWLIGLAALAGLGGCDSESSKAKSVAVNSALAETAAPRVPARPAQVELVWPVPNRAYFEGAGFEAFVQPTESGEIASGLFGSTRSGGRQFHEGLDLFPIKRDARGEAADDVFAALAGVVRHVSDRAGASSYGRYVVLEHPAESPPVYTLYSHLAEIDPSVREGVRVTAGARLGLMGRSAGGYTIPKERAHLHFEIGLRVTDRFQAWYDGRKFGSRNEHGLYNGMNLMGLDPLDFFGRHKAGGLHSLDEVFRETPAALKLRIAHAGEPDFVTRYPSLVKRLAGLRGGWEIEFSATGVPVRWREISLGEFAGWKPGEARILSADQALLDANRGRDLVRTVRGRQVPGRDLRTVLEQLFAWKG